MILAVTIFLVLNVNKGENILQQDSLPLTLRGNTKDPLHTNQGLPPLFHQLEEGVGGWVHLGPDTLLPTLDLVPPFGPWT